MSQPPVLHRKPFMVALFLFLAAVALMIWGWYRSGPLSDSNGFGLFFIGFFLVITAVIIAAVYLGQERQYRRAVRQPLLIYQLDPAWSEAAVAKNSAEIKGQNKIMLLVMLFFCALLAIIGLFLGEDGLLFSLIAVCLGAFLTLSAWLITVYRIHKLKAGGHFVLLGLDGALVSGQFHAWSMLGARLDRLSYEPADPSAGRPGDLFIVYSAPGRYGRTTASLHLLVPPDREPEALAAMQQLRQKHRLKGA
jgi:hypothetical protein